MATSAYRDKRLESTKAAIERLQVKKAKAEADIAKAEAEIDRYEGLIEWLKNMPVE